MGLARMTQFEVGLVLDPVDPDSSNSLTSEIHMTSVKLFGIRDD